MSTATLSKAQRKQLRKQMMQRKEELMAKHGRSGGNARSFAQVKPKLPADVTPKPQPTPKPQVAASVTPVGTTRWNQPAPYRSLPTTAPQAVRPAATPISTTPPTPSPYRAAPAAAPIRDLDEAGPGPLTRAAVMIERVTRRALHAWQTRPWKDTGEPRRSDAHRSLSLVVRPLRWMGFVSIAGAIAMGRTSRDMGASELGSLVVLGMGLSLAVGLFALAEIARGLRTLIRTR